MADESVFNHIGHCVTDLDRSRRFYSELFGFELVNEHSIPDNPTARLLQIGPPLGMTVTYLIKGRLVLELMRFEREGNPASRARVLNEPGLTHLSFSVDDVSGTAARAVELGGEILADTDLGAAVFIRDPDGQLIELVAKDWRRSIDGR